jgi:hypothetical protein
LEISILQVIARHATFSSRYKIMGYFPTDIYLFIYIYIYIYIFKTLNY